MLGVCLWLAVPLWRPAGGLAAGTSCWSRVTSPCGPATSRIRWQGFGWAGAGTWESCRCLETPQSSSGTWVGDYSVKCVSCCQNITYYVLRSISRGDWFLLQDKRLNMFFWEIKVDFIPFTNCSQADFILPVTPHTSATRTILSFSNKTYNF